MGHANKPTGGFPYGLGYQAGKAGEITKNPFASFSAKRQKEWLNGWKAGDTDAKAMQGVAKDAAGAS